MEEIKKMTSREENTDYFTLYYRENNRPVVCDCGREVTFFYMQKHLKTKMHQKKLLQKEEELAKLLTEKN